MSFNKKNKDDNDESEQNVEEISTSTNANDDSTDISEISQDEHPSQNKSLLYKLKSKINSIGPKKNAKESNSTEAKKKRSRIIQLVIVILLLIFISDSFITSEETPVAEAPAKLKPKYKKNPPKAPEVAPVNPPEDGISPEKEITENVPTEIKPEESVISSIVEDTPIEAPRPDEPTSSLENPPETLSPDIVDNTQTPPTTDSGINDQILEDLENQAKKETKILETIKDYITPPDYEYLGRGLVYNCLGKHWACIDAPSYKKCEENASSVKYLKRKTECYPFNVYETLKGCENIQNRMVSSIAKTNFCSE